MKTEAAETLQEEVDEQVTRAHSVHHSARDRAARQAGDAVRTYDSHVRGLAKDAPVPVDEAVVRYPWATTSLVLVMGTVLGFVTGAVAALTVGALVNGSPNSNRDRCEEPGHAGAAAH